MSQSIKLGPTIFSLFARNSFIFFVILPLFFAPVVISQIRVDSNQVAQEIRTLELGKPIECELKGGEVHVYQITLAANQYLHVVVDQRGIDVLVVLLGPDGKQLIEMDSPNGTQGPEPISLVIDTLGTYRLEVRSFEKTAAAGRYEVRIEELRTATPQDRIRLVAKTAFTEGEKLFAQRKPEFLQRAVKKYEEALQFWRVTGDSSMEARTLNNMGGAYMSLGEMQRAITYFNNALILFENMHDHKWEATALQNIGKVYHMLEEYQKALDYYCKALPVSKPAHDRPGEAFILNSIGMVYEDLGEYQRALDHYGQALSLCRAEKYSRLETYASINIGKIYYFLGDEQKALDYYNQALPLLRSVGDSSGEVFVLNDIGLVYDSLGEPQKALDYCYQALNLSRAMGNPPEENAPMLHNIGGIYESALGNNEKALDYLTQALPLWRIVGDRKNEVATLVGIARAKRNLGNLVEARAQMESALDIIESLRAKVVSQQLRTSYFATIQQHYMYYIELLMQLHQSHPSERYDAAGFHASERARARSLLETLIEAHVDIRQGIDSVVINRERTLQQQINSQAVRLTRLLNSKHTRDDSVTAQKELNGLLAQHQEAQAHIRATSPGYAALIMPQPLRVEEIQQQVLDDDTILLEYALGDEHSFLWMVTPTSINSFELPKRTVIDSLARRVYEFLSARNQRPANETLTARKVRIAQADTEYQKAATELSQMLLGPVFGQLGAKRLLVVTDGALQYIPFGALPVPNAGGISVKEIRPPLMMEHEIVSVPSASVLAILRRELSGRHSAAKTVAVLADPVFTNRDPRVKHNIIAQKKASESSIDSGAVNLGELALQRAVRDARVTEVGLDNIPRLVFSRQEAEGIAALVPLEERIKALDFAANRSIATSAALSQYRIVHFATHGLLNSVNPELSGIVLSLVDEQGESQDGFLRLHEIYNLNLPADLVVLSACQTALGKEIKGEGLVGLTRGFMYAGTPRVVASLWKVDDEATAELMKRFYKKMLGSEKFRPAAALQAAQVSMWQEKRWKSPYHWAAFILQGEWR